MEWVFACVKLFTKGTMKEFFKRVLTSIFLVVIFGGAYLHSMLLFMFLLAVIFLVVLFVEWPRLLPSHGLEAILVSLIYPGLPIMGMLGLHILYYVRDFYFPLYPFFIAWAADTGGYVVGKICGKHKICPTISPGKSWEGLMGSFAAVFIINMLILPRITSNFSLFIQANSIFLMIFFSLALTVLSFFGGLFLSLLKRGKQLKDAGNILPGHGGFLDRFDSVFAVVLGIWAMLLFPVFVEHGKTLGNQVIKSFTISSK